jgi:hypothetical protein
MIKLFTASICFLYLCSTWASISSHLEIEVVQVKKLIKSSKKGYENSYLLIGKVSYIKETELGVETHLIKEETTAEILLDKEICYDEVLIMLHSSRKFKLKFSNLDKKILKFVNKPEYTIFLKSNILKTEDHPSASCSLELDFP